MPVKSKICFGKNGEPLTEYVSEYDAKQGAEHVKISYGQDLISKGKFPAACGEKNKVIPETIPRCLRRGVSFPYWCSCCGKWHLSPKNRRTPSRTCTFCKDSSGNSKELYETEEAAVQRAKIIEKEQGIKLKVYHCHYANGYHLTKSARGR